MNESHTFGLLFLWLFAFLLLLMSVAFSFLALRIILNGSSRLMFIHYIYENSEFDEIKIVIVYFMISLLYFCFAFIYILTLLIYSFI